MEFPANKYVLMYLEKIVSKMVHKEKICYLFTGLNFSRITNVKPPSNFVDETRSADASMMSGKMKVRQLSKKTDSTTK